MAKLIVEERLDASRIFNMDETSFVSKARSKKVVAVRGSRNVWSSEATPGFHLTFVAAVSAAGYSVPPLLILPGVRLARTVVNAVSIPGAAITTAAKGFINGALFKKWLVHFATLVPEEVKRPIVLLLDNCSTHIDVGKSLVF